MIVTVLNIVVFILYIVLFIFIYHAWVTNDAFFQEYFRDHLPKFSYSCEGVIYSMQASEVVAKAYSSSDALNGMDLLCRTEKHNWFLLGLERDYRLCAWNATMKVNFTPLSKTDAQEWLDGTKERQIMFPAK